MHESAPLRHDHKHLPSFYVDRPVALPYPCAARYSLYRLLAMSRSRRFLTPALIISAGLAFASCDTIADNVRPTEITFGGVTYAVIGQARLEQSDAGLLVNNIGSSGSDGVRVTPTSPIELADIRTLPVDLPDNGRWGMQVFGETSSGRTALATVWNEAVSSEEYDILFEFAPEMNVSRMTVEYYLEGQLVHSVEIPADGAGNVLSRAVSAGRGNRTPSSVHVICVGGELIVATDHAGEAPKMGSSGCAGELLANVPGAELPVCVDFVRARPITKSSFPEATSLEMTARTLPDFTIIAGSVE